MIVSHQIDFGKTQSYMKKYFFPKSTQITLQKLEKIYYV